MKDKIFIDDNFCFACGENNPQGLRLKFFERDGLIQAECVLGKEYQGYKNILHGGMVCLLLDEASAWVMRGKGYYATAKIEVRLRKPVFTGVPIKLEAWKEKGSSGYVLCRANLLQEGSLKAQAEVLLVKVDEG